MSKLSPGSLLLGIMAVLFGLLGAYVVRMQMQQPVVAAPAPQTMVVPRASTDLKAGRKITLGDIAIYRMTREELREAGIRGGFMSNPEQIIGRILREDLVRGDTFDTTKLYPEGVFPNPAERLRPGHRAVTVTVEGPAAVAGFATPGAWVDVLFRANKQEEDGLPETTVTLVEGVEVLALEEQTFTGARPDDNRSRIREMAVTLAVTPAQAAALRVVEGHGILSLALRKPDDDTPLAGELPRTINEVLDRPNTRWRMEVYRGGSPNLIHFRQQQRQISGSVVAAPSSAPTRRTVDQVPTEPVQSSMQD